MPVHIIRTRHDEPESDGRLCEVTRYEFREFVVPECELVAEDEVEDVGERKAAA